MRGPMTRSERQAPPLPRGALVLTCLALVLLNLAVAYLGASAVGVRPLPVPDVVVVGVLTLGMVCGALAVLGWRGYVRRARETALPRS